MNNKKKVALSIALAMSVGHATAADSISYRGSIKTEMPTVTSTQTATPVAFVKDFKLSLGSDGGICELTTDDAYARKTVNSSGKWICLVEWDSERYGLAPSKLDLAGVLNAEGSLSLGYKLSVYSEGAKQSITAAAISTTANAPVAPVVKDYSIRWAKRTEKTVGAEQWIYDKADSIGDINVTVDKRPFTQTVTVSGQTCTVAEGAETCQIRINKAMAELPDLQGQLTYQGAAADTKGYFANPAVSSLLVNWDFRAPTISHTAYNVTPDLLPKDVSFDGVNITLPANSAAVFVKSPHTDKAGEWWKPTDMTMKLSKSDGKAHNAVNEVAGVPVRFDVPNIGYTASYTAKAAAAPIIQNGYLVYTYDLTKIPDGKYDVSAKAADIYANSTTTNQTETLIDRYGPDIKVLSNTTVLTGAKTELYFTEDLTVAANGGWEDGTTIKSIKWNGVPSEFTGDLAHVKVPAHNEFSLDTQVELEVTAVDGAGNETIKKYAFQYMPVAFELGGVPDNIFASVESTSMRLSQTKGIKCKTSTSPELAQAQAKGAFKGCTVVWDNLPAGLESVVYPTSFALQGGIDSVGQTSWGYNVYFHNKNGYMAKAAEGTVSVDVKESEHPQMTLTTLNKLEDGVYGVSRNSNQITRYELTTVPADNILQVKAANGETDATYTLKQRLKSETYTIRSALKRTKRDDLMAWDRTTYTVSAHHKRKPESATSQTFDLITFPDGGVKSLLSLETKESTNAETLVANVSVAKKSSGKFQYNIPQMGRWKTYLAIRENGKYEAITPTIDLDEQGKGAFTFEAAKLFDKTNGVYAVSQSISPFPKYNRTLISSSAKLAVFQSEAIAGDLAARTISGRVPFTASMYFDYEDKNDKLASSGFEWETSTDETNWTKIDVKEKQKVYGAKIQEVGATFYRIKMTNKMTQEVSYTAPIRVVGYKTPDVWIEGEDTVYAGGYATLTVFSDETSDIQNDGFTEWSTDGGQTWVTGDAVQEFKVDQTMKILARYRLNTTDETVGDEGFQVADHKVTAVAVAPVRVSATGPKHAEIGSKVILKATAQHSNRNVKDKLFTYWTTPSGEVIDGTNIEYTVKESDVQDGEIGNFVFTSYVDGLEEATKSTAAVTMNLWSYTMPDIKLALLSRVQIAPANIAARVDIPYFYAPGVELQYQWILPEGVSISRESSSLTYLSAANAGVQRIGILLTDNRGNSKEVFEFIDIVQADPLAIGVEIKPSNVFERVPVSYGVRTNAKPGHPNDKMKSYQWLLDGKELEGQVKPYANVEIKEAGKHQLTVKFLTEYGQTGELNEELTVVPNKPPVCTPTITESSSSITVNANCKDEDGKIISLKYTWREDGYESSGGTRIRFTKSLHDKLRVQVRATDDSGEDSIAVIEWTNPTQTTTTN